MWIKLKYKNKKITLCVVAIIVNSLVVFSDNKSEYTIIGTLPDSIENINVFLAHIWPANPLITAEGESNKLDSAFIQNGKFMFKGVIKDNCKNLYGISSEDQNWNGLVRRLIG